MLCLQVMLRQSNPWVQDFIHASEVPAADVEQLQLVISAAARPAGQHERRYNRPEGFNEVSVLIGEEPAHQDIVLRRRNVEDQPYLQIIHETHRAAEPLHFILLFPWGTDGWHSNMEQTRANQRGQVRTVTAQDYYAHRLQVSDRKRHYIAYCCMSCYCVFSFLLTFDSPGPTLLYVMRVV